MEKNSVRILIISRDEFLLDFFSRFLIGEGYNISTSRGGIDALKYIESEELSLVLLEDGLPRIDEKTFVSKIKVIKDIPVILIAAGGINHRTITALQEGANDYIEAPSEITEIRKKIQKNLKEERYG